MATNVENIKEETLVTILFADVVGSTRLYEELGDDAARETVQRCVEIMKEATEQYGGSVIKTIGDEVMSTFPSADDAMNAASQMQQRITNSDSLTGDKNSQVAIRIGSHYGPVVVEDRDIFGAAVATANRMTSQAKAGQIITTQVTVDQLSGEWRALCRQIDVAVVPGQADEVHVHEVLWQPEEATSMLPAIQIQGQKEQVKRTMQLTFGDQSVSVGDEALLKITLGRADDNNLVIKGKLISRVHARVEYKKNHFMLVDESTNGSFVIRSDGEEFYVRRDSQELTGSGTIGLGKAAKPGTSLAIHYEIS